MNKKFKLNIETDTLPTMYGDQTGTIEFNNPGDQGCYKSYWVNGNLHREDGPACEFANGTKEYWINGTLHREDGPAVEWYDGRKEYWINGWRLTKKEFDKRKNSCDNK